MSDHEEQLKQMQDSPALTMSLALRPVMADIAQSLNQVGQAFSVMAPAFADFTRQLKRAHYRLTPYWERKRREEKRQARIKRAEIKAERKARRRKPRLWAGETLQEWKWDQVIHWNLPTSSRMATGSLRFPESTTPGQMLAAFGIIDDPALGK